MLDDARHETVRGAGPGVLGPGKVPLFVGRVSLAALKTVREEGRGVHS
jgi:hypothetical protein